MAQVNIKKTAVFNIPPENTRAYSFDFFGNAGIVNEQGVFVPLNFDTQIRNIIATLGIGLEVDLPANPNIGDIYITSDSFKKYTSSDSISWVVEDLQNGQFITDSINVILYQYNENALTLLCKAVHDHSDDSNGGNIPIASVTGLVDELGLKVAGPASSTVNEVSIYSATDGKNVKTSGKIIVSNQTDLKTALALTTAHRIEVTKDITVSGTVTFGEVHYVQGVVISFADGIVFSSTKVTGSIIDANCNFLGDAVYTSDYNTTLNIRLVTGSPTFTKTTTGELMLRINSVEKNSRITSTAGTITYEDENYFASYEKKPTFTTAFTSTIYDNGNSGTSITLDPANGQSQKLTLTGTCAITLASVTGSVRFSVKLIQDATGLRDVTFTNTVLNPNEFVFTEGAAAQICNMTLFYDGEVWWMAATKYTDL